VITGGPGPLAVNGYADDQNNVVNCDGYSTINFGNGDNTIVGGPGQLYVYAGDGGNTVSCAGPYSDVQLGNGDNTVYAGGGTDLLGAGNGDNTFYLGDGAAERERFTRIVARSGRGRLWGPSKTGIRLRPAREKEVASSAA